MQQAVGNWWLDDRIKVGNDHTIGQPDAGVMSGSGYTLAGGF